jgi:hypothetical protein
MEGATITGIKFKTSKASADLEISETWPVKSSLDWLHNLTRIKNNKNVLKNDV